MLNYKVNALQKEVRMTHRLGCIQVDEGKVDEGKVEVDKG